MIRVVDATRPASQPVVTPGEAGCAYGPAARGITHHVMISIQDVEKFIPIVKPLFDGLRSVRDLWDFFRALRRGADRRPQARQGLDTQDNKRESNGERPTT
jgi:hypothetical protein